MTAPDGAEAALASAEERLERTVEQPPARTVLLWAAVSAATWSFFGPSSSASNAAVAATATTASAADLRKPRSELMSQQRAQPTVPCRRVGRCGRLARVRDRSSVPP